MTINIYKQIKTLIVMKKIAILAAVCALVHVPCEAVAQVSAKIIEQALTPSVTDTDDNRIYASMSYTIEVVGAEGHTLRVEVPWKDASNKPVYFNIDEGEEAISHDTYQIEAGTDTIVGWCGVYHDAMWLKPGVQKVNGTIRIYDETMGKYITVTGARKHTFSYTSQTRAKGVNLTSNYLDHNQYVNGNKVMYVRYALDINWMKGRTVRCDITLHKWGGASILDKKGKPFKNTTTYTPSYTFSNWTDRWCWFSYAHMKMPVGQTRCYALIRFYDAKTGALLKSSEKLEFNFNRGR